MKYYNDDLIVKRVSKKVRERTRENMDSDCMGLYDAFREAAFTYSKNGTKLYKAWYHDDFREFIPSAYDPKYLNFKQHPLNY